MYPFTLNNAYAQKEQFFTLFLQRNKPLWYFTIRESRSLSTWKNRLHGIPFSILLGTIYLFSSWYLRQDLWSLRLTHWLCSSGLTGGCCLWKWILHCLLRGGCLLYSLLLRIKYNYSVLFQVINSMFSRNYVCLRPSVFENDFSNQDKPKFINFPLHFFFPLVFFTCGGTTKNN